MSNTYLYLFILIYTISQLFYGGPKELLNWLEIHL